MLAAGHGLFAWGKRSAAAMPWHPLQNSDDERAPVLFLRSFEDDQFQFRRPSWQLHMRWFDLWSFRRNVNEAMIDEVALYGPVVALGRPGDREAPFSEGLLCQPCRFAGVVIGRRAASAPSCW